jgi:hypothetical protein
VTARAFRVFAAAALLIAALPTSAPAQETLSILARVGPWPVAAEPIAYRGRLWFANSVKGRNHNSADIHSYDPATRALRYERHLFSQDAGQPLVAAGLLYWPFEDSRISLGWGHFLVTNGEDWRHGTIPTAQIFHVHAMAAAGERIIAATSAWRAGLQASDDGGVTWRALYDHPTPAGRVSRIVELASLEAAAFGALTGREGRALLKLEGDEVAPLSDWPGTQPLVAMTAFQGRLLGLVREAGGTAVWRSDGRTSERLAAARPDWQPVAMTAGAGWLWAVGPGEAGGLLWRSRDGIDWEAHRRLAGGRPQGLALLDGGVYVTGAGDDGRGILWGPSGPVPISTAAGPPPALPVPREDTALDWGAAREDLREAFADPASYPSHAPALRDRVYRAALAGPPADFFAGLLDAPMPQEPISLIGGAVTVPAQRFGRWILLWGMALAGRGHVPPAMIAAPWTAPGNGSEKYFETAPAALWAAAMIGQKDRASLDAMIDRLARPGDPDWLIGDVVGALTALTGQRFAYDLAAWEDWWRRARPIWPN